MAGFRFVRLSGSVGEGGRNAYPDVVAVQELLNATLPGTPHHLAIDGRCRPLTLAAIRKAEEVFIHAAVPDGRVDPGGPTLHAMNYTRRAASIANVPRPRPAAAPVARVAPGQAGGTASAPPKPGATPAGPVPVAPPPISGAAAGGAPGAPPGQSAAGSTEMVGKHEGEVTPAAGKAAQDTQRAWGVPASVTLTQYITESGAGHHMPHASNNPFGIKAGKGQPSVMAWTYEYLKDGTRIHILAPFRAFKSIGEAFDAHGQLLAHHPAYAEARKHLNDADAFARGLEGHYSTTKGYGQSLIDQMKAHDLYRFNLAH